MHASSCSLNAPFHNQKRFFATMLGRFGASLLALAATFMSSALVMAAEPAGLISGIRRQPPAKASEETPKPAHSKSIRAVAVTENGALAATTAADGTIRIWDLRKGGKLLHELTQNYVGETRSLAFSPNGKMLAMINAGQIIRLWDCESNKETQFDSGEFRVTRAVAFSPDGALFATADRVIVDANSTLTCQVSLWDLATKKIKLVLAKQEDRINDLMFSGDGKMLAVGDENGVVRVWKIADQRKLFESERVEEQILSVAMSRSGKTLASAGGSGKIRVWSTSTWKPIDVSGLKATGGCVAFVGDGEHLVVSGGKDGNMRICDLAKSKELKLLAGHKNFVSSMSVAPKSKLLVSGDWDGIVRIWNLETGAKSFLRQPD